MPGTQAICDVDIETPGAQTIRDVVNERQWHMLYMVYRNIYLVVSSNMLNIMK